MLLASREINVACDDIYYLGDAERDIIAGNVCNMKTVVVNWGYLKYPNEGDTWGADHIIDEPMQFLQLAK